MGENGLIRQAEKAGEHQANAEAEDNAKLDILDQYLANAIGGNSGRGNGGNSGGTQTPTEPLQISYTIEDIDKSGKAVVLRYTGAYASYKEYAEQILEGKSETEVAQIFVEGANYWSEQYGDPTYADINELMEDWYGEVITIEEMCQEEGYDSFAEMIIHWRYVKPAGYQGPTVLSTAKNGTHEVTGVVSEFIATRNGTYIVEATTTDGREAEIQVNVTGIVEEKFSEIYDITTTYTDTNGKTAKIPAGFAVGTSSGINTVADGLVITDAVDSQGYSIGNEYVWIPVESDETFKRENFNNYVDSYWNKLTEPLSYNGAIGYATEKTEYNTMRTQVLAYNGFYIGRYEAGVNTATQRDNPTAGAQKVVSKRGAAPYNHVVWGASMSDIDSDVTEYIYDEITGNETELQTKGAVYLSQKIYTGKTQANSVTSTLIYGVQWDAMCRYITDYTRTTSTKNGVDLTGRVGGDNSKNIYDLAGNCCEWTMEAYQNIERNLRGGHFNYECAVSSRVQNIDHTAQNSFRCALYINIPISSGEK